jgi:hypothetical protein
MPGFLLPVLLALCACNAPSAATTETGKPASMVVAGELDEKDLKEASGMTYSARRDDLLWVHNDSGNKPRLYAIDLAGKLQGRLKLEQADNEDWEDIAAFELDGEPYLLIADIGNNDGKRDHVSLYIVAEPDLSEDDKQSSAPAWRIDFTYPDGPHDAEAVAVDSERERVLILSKREIPPRLYEVPLRPASDKLQTARLLEPLATLPAPTRQAVEFAPRSKDWHWQPVAMDVSRDTSVLVIMTYGALYYYQRHGNEDWAQALRRPPLVFGLGNMRDNEAAAISADGRTIFVTVEKKHAPLYRIDIRQEDDAQ